uniref:Amidohydrolase-related domain-containing protein n=1 Tax=Globisporangium ultimum (strain ATCC 200006 / CBS 805.95 / DAOM BR144) TaxID=431595 RepID=K3X1M4_GLOUD
MASTPAARTTKTAVDLVIYASHVIPVVPRDAVLRDHAVVVQHGCIINVLPREQALEIYKPERVQDLKDHILIPGLVNAHTHAPLSLLRGLADDLPVCDWQTKWIWPAEGEFLSEEFVSDGVVHATAEMIRGGTTCMNDMFHFGKESCDVVERVGIRAVIGPMIMEFPSASAKDTDDYFEKTRVLLEKYKNHEIIRIGMAPHNTSVAGDATLQKVNEWSEKYNVPFNIHLHESASECDDSESLNRESLNCHRSDQKLRPLANLKRLGLLSERLVCVHMAQLTGQEIQDVADAQAHVVHCPTSDLKLAGGVCRVTDLLKSGVNVAIGTEGAFCNNSLNMFAEMKLAAILAKAESKEPTSVPAATALQMATLNGARAIGLGNEIGSIEVGKRADLVAVECDNIEMLPMYNAISHVVYVAGRENVSDVWINGKHVLADRKMTTIDEAQVKADKY